MALVDVLRKDEDPEANFPQEGVRRLVQGLMEADVSARIGARRQADLVERSDNPLHGRRAVYSWL